MSTRRALLSSSAVIPIVFTDFTKINSVLPSSLYTYSGASLRTITDGLGNITYAPNNLFLNNTVLSTQNVATNGVSSYIISFYGTGSVTLSGTATGTISGTGASNQVYLKVTPSTGTLTATVTGSVTNAVIAAVTYETVPRPGDQVVTTSANFYGPAFDYDPTTHAPLGLRIEQASTNYSRNSQMSGAASGSPGTVPTNWYVGVNNGLATTLTVGSTYQGQPYLRVNIAGTTTASATAITIQFESNNALIAASQSQVWTNSAYMRLVSGSFSSGFPNLLITENNSSGVFLTNGANTPSLTASFAKYAYTRTLANAATAFVVPGIYAQWPTSGTVVNVTFDIMLTQFEQTPVPTSYIPTNGTAISRAADNLAFGGQALACLCSGAGSVVVESGIATTAFSRMIGDTLGYATIGIGGNGLQLQSWNGSALNAYPGASLNMFVAPIFRSGTAWSGLNRYLGVNGGTVTSDAGGTISKASGFYLGFAAYAAYYNGHFSKVAFYKQALTPAQLQARTILGAPL